MSSYLCNLIVPGFAKSGTSSFHEYLAEHPDICMSNHKEPHYFSVCRRWENGPEFHNSLFQCVQGNTRYYGESSTTYCIHEPAIQRIKECLDSPKIILILRNPLERVISHYNWLYSLGLETRSLLDAVEQSGREFDPDNNLMGNYSAYLAFSAYSRYVPLWQDAFGDENVFLVESGNLNSEPQQILDSVFEFLELPKIAGMETLHKNITKNIQPISKPGRVWGARKIIPEPIRSLAISNSLTARAWQYLTARKKIIPPEISSSDMEMLEKALEEDTCYFNRLFNNYLNSS